MLAAANLGQRRGLLSDDGHARLTTAVAGLGPLPAIDSVEADDLRSHIGRDKKMDDAGVQWVLPTDNGVVLAQRVTTDEAIEVFQELQADTK
jgi:3-dehydroquinate synthetase